MKRFVILTTFFIGMAATIAAQPQAGTFSIIPRIGVNLAKITGDNVYHFDANSGFAEASKPKYKPGLMAGLDIEYQITNKIAASIGAYYSREGEKYDDVTEAHDISTKKWSEVRDWKQHHDYINIPLMISAYAAKNLAFKAGVQVGFNTNAKMEYTEATFSRNDAGEASTENVEKIKSDVDVKNVDISIPVGLSYEYMNVILDARYNIGLTKIYNKMDGRNSIFSFSAGYRFKL